MRMNRNDQPGSYHEPVMLRESIEGLNLQDGGVYLDATLGGGGHSGAILRANASVRLFSFDTDQEALTYATERLKEFSDRHVIINDNFSNLRNRMALECVKKVDGVLFDLGVSSHQFDSSERGFSFQGEGRLDMRMNSNQELSAYEIVNEADLETLTGIIRDYGEEKEAYRIALGIIRAREAKPIQTTMELGDIVEMAVRGPQKVKSKARVFQALRIRVNNELEVLSKALKDAIAILQPKGRVVVISYHSLEDRIVKRLFQEEEKACVCPSNFPMCNCGKTSTIRVITKKPVEASSEEIERNSRARSAKLRIAEKRGRI